MTTPGGFYPDDAITDDDLSGLNGLDEATWRAGLNDQVIGPDTGAGGGFNGLFGGLGLFVSSTVDNDYVSQLPVVNDHSASITEIRETIERMVLQGEAIVFTGNGTYTRPDGLVSADVIIIGAGGSGGGGVKGQGDDSLDVVYSGGYAGGGGGEVHTNIPATLIGDTVPVVVGKARAPGSGDGDPGYGGGDTSFGELSAGGGMGGFSSTSGNLTVSGGFGMIPGGDGGRPGRRYDKWDGGSYDHTDTAATPGAGSQSAFSLNNGGGGGGGGGARYSGLKASAAAGGAGSVAAGGAIGQPGHNPPDVAAIGAGGGGGSNYSNASGGAGGYPGGAGGGGCGEQTTGIGNHWTASGGGRGGNGIVFVLERFT